MVEGDYVVPNSQQPQYSEQDFVYHFVVNFVEDEIAGNAIVEELVDSANVGLVVVSVLYGQPKIKNYTI